MVRLERYAQERKEFDKALSFSYAEAQRNIKALYGKQGDKLRFTEKPRMYDIGGLTGADLERANVTALRAKIRAMKKFLESESSTIGATYEGGKKITGGLKEVFDKRTDTINKKYLEEYGLELSPQDMKNFFNSRKQAKLASIVGSDNMFIIAAVLKKNKVGANKRDLLNYFKHHISADDIDDNNIRLSERDWKGKSASDVYESLREYASITEDPVLDAYIGDAIAQGISYKNIFLK